jgi:hypothetical protein
MRFPLAAVVAFGMAVSGGAGAWAQTQATPSALEAQPAGWADLIAEAGPDLNGWTRGPIPPGGTLGAASPWVVDRERGLLVCKGDESGHEWLRYDKPLRDHVFHAEWRFVPVPGKKGYNAGLYARNGADAAIWHQAQTGDASGGFLFGESRTSDGQKTRLNLSKSVADGRVRPAGEWNTFEITAKGRVMSLWVNGAVVCRWDDCQVPSGHIGLEAEGYRIEFRNLKLKTLPE